jgi:hypothetical protein
MLFLMVFLKVLLEVLFKSICFIVGIFYLGEFLVFWFNNPELTKMELMNERGAEVVGGSITLAYSIMSIGRSI